MANIELQGNQYLNVPYVDLPTTDQSTARFWEDILKMGVLRNDAELVQTWSKDSLFVTDDGGTIPAYTTTATTLVASGDLTPTYTVSFATYNYYVLVRALTIPIYNTSTKSAGRPDYSILYGAYELVEFPASTFKSLDGSKSYASRTFSTTATGSGNRMPYWTSATAISVYSSTTYGINQVIAAPGVSSSTFTVRNPSLQIRGSTTYLTSAVWATLTDIRVQYIIEMYRVPKGHLNLNGWGLYQQGQHVIDCATSANHKLT